MNRIRIICVLLHILNRITIILARSSNQSIEIHQELVGSSITLDCPLGNVPSSKPFDDNIKLIFWSKHPSNLISVIDLSILKNVSQQYSGEIFPRYRNRISHILDTGLWRSKLILNSVTLEDEGLYRCRVDYRRSRTTEMYHQIELIIPPKKLIIIDKNQKRISHSEYRIGPFDEGEANVSISCQTKFVKPAPKLYWFENSTLVDDSYHLIDNTSVEDPSEKLLANDQRFVRTQNILTLSGMMKRSDFDRKFVCVGQNTPISVHKQASVTVKLDLNLAPVSAEITTQNTFVSGQKIALVCRSFGSRPRAQLLWFKNREPIFDNIDTRYDSNNNISYSVVQFRVDAQDNGSEVQCKAVNVKMKNNLRNSVVDSIILNIQFAPILRIFSNDSTRENSTIRLHCLIHSNPPTPHHKIEWQQNNETIHRNHSSRIEFLNDTLILHNSTEADSGYYRCLASNTVGRSSSSLFPVSVEFAPRCSNLTQQIVHISYNSTNSAIIECRVKANPPVVYYDWSINGTSIGHLTYTTRGGLLSNLFYRPRTLYDYGNITCNARNSVGTMIQPCQYRVIPQGIPSPIRSCTLVTQNRFEALLKCRFSFDGGLRSGCKAELFLFNELLWKGTLWPATHGRKGYSCKSDIVFNSSKIPELGDLKIRGLARSFNDIGESPDEHEFHSTLYFLSAMKNNNIKDKNTANENIRDGTDLTDSFPWIYITLAGTILCFVCFYYYFHYQNSSKPKENNIRKLMRMERQLQGDFV